MEGGTSEPMSQLLGVERDRRKERQSDRGQELNSSPALPPSPSDSLPLKLSGSRDPETVPAYSYTKVSCIMSGGCAVSGEKELGNRENWRREAEKETERERSV